MPRMRGFLVILIAVASVGCDSKSKSEPPGAKPEPAKPATPASPPKIECEKAIPKAIKDKYFPTAGPEFGQPIASPDGGFITGCRFQDKEPDRRTLIEYRCGEVFADLEAYLKLIEAQVAVKYERISGLGRGAYRSKSTFGILHRSLPCIIEIEAIRGEPRVEQQPLAIDLEAALVP
jgi:hypothetical protein